MPYVPGIVAGGRTGHFCHYSKCTPQAAYETALRKRKQSHSAMVADTFDVVQLNSTTLRPPAVPSEQFNTALEYTLAFGRSNSTNRTEYQTDTAKFWYDEDAGVCCLNDACCSMAKH